jgi:hypothetical protein
MARHLTGVDRKLVVDVSAAVATVAADDGGSVAVVVAVIMGLRFWRRRGELGIGEGAVN